MSPPVPGANGEAEVKPGSDLSEFTREPWLPVGTPFLSYASAPASLALGQEHGHEAAPAVSGPGRPRLVSGETFLAEAENRPQTWWWDGIIPQSGITLFAGNPLSYKTVILLTASVASKGGGLVGGRMVRPVRILYVKLEHLDSAYRDVLRRAARTYSPTDLNNFHLLRELNLEDPASLANIEGWAEDIDAEVIIIDSLRRAHSGDENSSQEVALVMRALQQLTAGGTRAVVAIHHLTRNTRELRGSTDFLAGADAEVRLTKETDGVVKVEARNHGGADIDLRLRVTFTEDALTVDPANDAGRDVGEDRALRDAIIRTCSPGPMTTTALREAVRRLLGSVQNDRVDVMAEELEREGRLRNAPGHGRGNHWVATVPGGGASPLPPPQ